MLQTAPWGALLHQAKNLEIHVVDHCNLDCVGCSHESPLLCKRFEEPRLLSDSLHRLWESYHAPLIKLLGGEPLLHPDLPSIIREVRQRTDSRIRLVTNGTLLNRRWTSLVGVHEIHISAYPDAELPSESELRQISCDLSAILTVQPFKAFRWHRSPTGHPPDTTRRVFKTCQLYHRWDCHTLRGGRFSPCPPAATWGTSPWDEIDLLDPDVDVADALSRLLNRKEPLGTCGSCLGSAGQLLSHRRGWRQERGSLVGAKLDEAFLGRLEDDPDTWNGCWSYARSFHPDGTVEAHAA